MYKVVMESVLDLYKKGKKRRDEKIKNKSNLHIGRSESLSRYFEENFAKKLSKEFPFYDVFLDYPVAITTNAKKEKGHNIYPDILITERINGEKVLKAIIELKLSISYLDIEKIHKREIKLKRAEKLSYNSISGAYLTKEEKKEIQNYKDNISVPNDFKNKFCIVVMEDKRNVKGKLKIDEYFTSLEKYDYKIIHLNLKNYYYAFFKLSEIKKEIEDQRIIINEKFSSLK